MEWREAIEKTDRFLSTKRVEDSRVCAELLAARLLKCSRGEIPAMAGRKVHEKHVEALRRAIRRLSDFEPLQYVLGEWDFRSLTLKCDKRALIPRPETEELVTRVLKKLKTFDAAARPFVIDVGTGTGAIILSIAREYKGEGVFLGSDISEDAVSLAKENAAKCGLENRVKFAVMDGLDDFDEPGIVDVLVSNPPYIASAECEKLAPNVKDWEPRLALDGGVSGLDFYDRYLSDALNVLKPGGSVFFEIGESQGAALSSMMADYGFTDVKIEKDYSGHDRYASGTLP